MEDCTRTGQVITRSHGSFLYLELTTFFSYVKFKVQYLKEVKSFYEERHSGEDRDLRRM